MRDIVKSIFKKLTKGFTLLELLSVIIILGIILTIAIFTGLKTIENSKERSFDEQVGRAIKIAKEWALENTEILPDNEDEKYQIGISEMKDLDLVKEIIIDPRNNEPMIGCIEISYDETYKYTYIENCDANGIYTITYNLNGGSVDGENPTTYTPRTNTFTLKNPSKEGYDFVGWESDEYEGTKNTVTIPKGTIGNKEYAAFFEVGDITKPTLTINSTYVNPTTSKIKITAEDKESGLSNENRYEYYISTSNTTQIGGSWTQYTSGVEFTINKTTGTYYIWVYSIKDNMGNYNEEHTSIVPYVIGTETFDSDKPTLTLTSSYTNPTTASVKITAADVGTGLSSNNKYQYYLSTSNTTQTGGSWVTYTSGTNFTLSKTTGTYYLWVYSIQDKAGNYNGSHTSVTPYVISTLIFDNENPVCTYTKSNINSASGVNISWSCTDVGSGLATPASGTITGAKTNQTVVARDNAGNVNNYVIPVSSKTIYNYRTCSGCGNYTCGGWSGPKSNCATGHNSGGSMYDIAPPGAQWNSGCSSKKGASGCPSTHYYCTGIYTRSCTRFDCATAGSCSTWSGWTATETPTTATKTTTLWREVTTTLVYY